MVSTASTLEVIGLQSFREWLAVTGCAGLMALEEVRRNSGKSSSMPSASETMTVRSSVVSLVDVVSEMMVCMSVSFSTLKDVRRNTIPSSPTSGSVVVTIVISGPLFCKAAVTKSAMVPFLLLVIVVLSVNAVNSTSSFVWK